jgi:hypothetical protein
MRKLLGVKQEERSRSHFGKRLAIALRESAESAFERMISIDQTQIPQIFAEKNRRRLATADVWAAARSIRLLATC